MAGKKSKNPDPPSTQVNMEAQLDKARASLEGYQRQMTTLHGVWRQQLRRIGVVMLVVVLNQLKTPVSGCLRDIRDRNDFLIGHLETVKYCAQDSVTEVMSVLCCSSITWLLYRPAGEDDFSSLPFRLAATFFALIVSSYFNNRTMGCLRHLDEDLTGADSTEETHRPFPVVLIFFVLVVLSLFFMKYQRTQHEDSVEQLDKLRKDLLASKKKK